MDLVPYRLSPELLRDIDAFRPEVIYSSIGNIQLASLVKNLARRENAATVVHLLDDWISNETCKLLGRSLASPGALEGKPRPY